MVRGDKHRITRRQGGFGYGAGAFVHHFYGFDHGIKIACVAHHIAVGKVNDDKVILIRGNLFERFVLDDIGFHFRVFGKGGGIKAALDFDAVFAGVRFNQLAVKKRSDVFKLLSFRQAQLL